MAQVNPEHSIAMPGAAAFANALYFKTGVSPEELFVAIGRLRREARDEIDRLIRFLDDTDDHMEREPDDDEPWLGWLEGRSSAWSGGSGDDRELDGADDEDGGDTEPSLGSLDHDQSQEVWGAGGRRDLERDPAESGIGDRDGLLEQVGTEDYWRGGLA
ncbi:MULTISPECIES: hypothetical protein [Bradyrhizobium]|uniref:hypothetical protein n=1 Tax=Bradyrhizobium elkanii TaxID=29448 RepID=UPI0027149ABF|nr:hypothetical protein [Bradyrhizobium elkanii]WLA47306.1 hypothetical protein QIH80_37385 [Bradyrhizobium elkanii]WLB82398.1 hypothetical protein QIH83_07390 [Bradyrhizobium elkanii]